MKARLLLITLLLSVTFVCRAEYYEMSIHDTVVGEMAKTYSRQDQTLPDIARIHDIGFMDIKRANQKVDTWMPGEKTEVVLAKQFVLPVAPPVGIIVNIPEMRLYYFPAGQKGETRQVYTYPIGIGREGWATPYITTKIIEKKKDPAWHPPESIRAEHAREGHPLPKVVPPGPENPLGQFAMRLGLPSYLIHGTNKPYGVGLRVSSGCIRMYPEDIKALFGMVPVNTPVRIVNQPYKVGVLNGKLLLEASPYLEEDTDQFEGNMTSVVKMLVEVSKQHKYEVDWDLIRKVISERDSIPVEIGRVLDEPLEEYTAADKSTRASVSDSTAASSSPVVQQ
jgi:L,D-transpeptidase ErfK/SrfK